MIRNARRVVLIPLTALFLASCSGSLAGTSTPSAASPDIASTTSVQDDAALSTRTALAALDTAPIATVAGHLYLGRQTIRPDAKSPALIAGFVAAGEAITGVPCIDCVNGASSGDNIGLAGPGNYVPSGATWQYSQAFTDVSFKGKCTLSWAIAAGKKVVDSFSASIKLTSSGGFVLYALDRNRPTFSGTAVLTSSAKCGANTVKATAPLYFQ